MKYSKWIRAALVAPAFLMTAGMAKADVFVYADIDKEKDVDVDVDVDIDKFVFLVTFDFINVDAVAEQLVIKNQRNQFNFVEDENALADAIIDTSGVSASGIVLINQSPGFVNNQGNEVSVTAATSPGNVGYRPVPSPTTTELNETYGNFDTDGDGLADVTRLIECISCGDDSVDEGLLVGDPFTVVRTTPLSISSASRAEVAEWAEATSGTFAHAEVSVQQINGWDPRTVIPNGDLELVTPTGYGNEYVNTFGSVLTDTITASFSGASGVVGINQAAGSLNNQNNALAIAVGDPAVYALGEADLGQFNTYNYVDTIDQIRTDTIDGGSFDGFAGVAMVNQSSGSVNNQANIVDIAITNELTVSTQLPFAQ
jgi:hypothetical protein